MAVLSKEGGIWLGMVGFQRVAGQHKAEVAAECGCTVRDVEDVVAKYEWAKEANRRVMKLKEEGKPLPKSLDEVGFSLVGLTSCNMLWIIESMIHSLPHVVILRRYFQPYFPGR